MSERQPYSFDGHPIFSKLSTFDRMAVQAELAAEFTSVYVKGQIDGIWYGVEMLKSIVKHSERITEDQQQALYAAAITLAKCGNEFLAEVQKGEESSFADES